MTTPSFSLTAAQNFSPKLALNFVAASLDPRVTLTRAGATATCIDSNGYVTTVAANMPRFDYNPITLICKGLLIEESRVNTYQYSQDFSQAYWAKSTNMTLGTAAGTSPDGTNNAFKIKETSASGAHGMEVTGGIAGLNGSYTFSYYVKAAERSWVYVGCFNTATKAAYFDLTNIAVGTATNCTASITDAGNGWRRVAVTATLTNSGTTFPYIYTATGNNTASFAGTTDYGLLVWGAQLEAGAFATSYIPTTSAALTRNADVATMTGTNFSDWFNANQGTFRVDAITSASGTRSLISADDNTSNNSLVMSTVGAAPKLTVTQNSVEQANVSAGTISANTPMFAYASYATNYFGIARPSARQVDTSGTVPTVDRLRIGTDQAGNYVNGHIQTVQFWP